MYQIARNAVADHGRTRARHPVAEPEEHVAESADDDRVAATALAACLSMFVARLPSPYREAITLVELEGMTIQAAAEIAGISLSGMKSRVQRGRAQLRAMLDACCAIAVDARGKVTNVVSRGNPACCGPVNPRSS
jgi:RNA polymerase sigma-70 factor (ECF subfamily)